MESAKLTEGFGGASSVFSWYISIGGGRYTAFGQLDVVPVFFISKFADMWQGLAFIFDRELELKFLQFAL